MLSVGVSAAFLATFAWSLCNIIIKRSATRLGTIKTGIIIVGSGVLPMLIALAVTGFQWPGIFLFSVSILCGFFLAFGAILNYKSMETEQITNIVILSEIQPAILTIFGVLAFQNHLTTAESISVLLVFAGAFFVVLTEGMRINRKMMPALLANIMWTAYWVLMAYAVSSTSGFALQVFTSRFVGLIMIVVLFYFIGTKKTPSLEGTKKKHNLYIMLILLTVVGGLLDGAGDTLFALTLHLNVVAIGGAIVAISPIIIAFLAYFIYKDRLAPIQLLGFIIMIIGAVGLAIA